MVFGSIPAAGPDDRTGSTSDNGKSIFHHRLRINRSVISWIGLSIRRSFMTMTMTYIREREVRHAVVRLRCNRTELSLANLEYSNIQRSSQKKLVTETGVRLPEAERFVEKRIPRSRINELIGRQRRKRSTSDDVNDDWRSEDRSLEMSVNHIERQRDGDVAGSEETNRARW